MIIDKFLVIYLREFVFMRPHFLEILISFTWGWLRYFVRPNLQINTELAACKSTRGGGEWDVITILYYVCACCYAIQSAGTLETANIIRGIHVLWITSYNTCISDTMHFNIINSRNSHFCKYYLLIFIHSG